jgi:hypothetical protein
MNEKDKRILDALQSGIEAGKRIREAREHGASAEEMARLEREAFGMQVTFDDDPHFVPAVVRGGKHA